MYNKYMAIMQLLASLLCAAAIEFGVLWPRWFIKNKKWRIAMTCVSVIIMMIIMGAYWMHLESNAWIECI